MAKVGQGESAPGFEGIKDSEGDIFGPVAPFMRGKTEQELMAFAERIEAGRGLGQSNASDFIPMREPLAAL